MVKLLFLLLMEVCVFSQQKSDEEILKEILVKNNLSIGDFTIYHSTSEISDFIKQPDLWYLIENNKVKMLRISNKKEVTHLDLSRLTNLEKLDLRDCNITDLSLSKLPPNLKEINLFWNKGLTRVDLSGLTNLEKLYLDWCNITDLKLSNLPNLKELYLSGNRRLSRVDLSGLTNLEKLDLGYCNITDLSLSKLPPNLKELNLSGNGGLTQVDLSGLTNLESLYLEDCENLNEVILSRRVKSKINIIGSLYKLNIIWR